MKFVSRSIMYLFACSSLWASNGQETDPQDIFVTPKQIGFYVLESVIPPPPPEPGESFEIIKPQPFFGDGVILERYTTGNEKLIAAVFDTLKEGFQKSEKGIAACFEPAYGLVFANGGDLIEATICFKCSRVHVTRNSDDFWIFTISDEVLPEFQKLVEEIRIDDKS